MTAHRSLVAARVVLALLGFSAIVTEVATLVAQDRFAAGDFVSFFTIESNSVAVVSLLLGALTAAAGHTSRALDLFRGLTTFMMTTVLVIFLVLLSGYPASELTAVPWDNTVLHYVMPVAVLLDWVVDPGRGTFRARAGLAWLAVPLAYLAYSLVRGAVVDWYPYPFIDPVEHGYLGVALTSLVIAVVLAGLALAIAAVPRLRGRLGS